MPIGFSSSYTQEFSLSNLTPDQWLVLAVETVQKLGWELGIVSPTALNAYTPASGQAGEVCTFVITPEKAFLKSEHLHENQIGQAKNRENIAMFLATFQTLAHTFTSDEFEQKYQELQPRFTDQEVTFAEEMPVSSPLTAQEKIGGFLSIFKPVEGYFITPILLIINIVIFLLMVVTGVGFFSPESEDLIKWGANFRTLTLGGEWWRLLTCCFIHIGVLHVAFNMYALVYIGMMLEPLLGKSRFLTAYLLTGITSSLASLWWHDFSVSAGASGAIFGMYGVFLALLTTKLLEEASRKALLSSISIFIGYNLFFGFSSGIVDNAGHIGGLLGGVLIGYAYVPSFKRPGQVRVTYLTLVLLCIAVGLLSLLAYRYIPNNGGKYVTAMNEFAVLEKEAVAIYNLPVSTSRDTLIQVLENKTLPAWRKNIQLLQELEKLNLPESTQKQNKQLMQYSQLRLRREELYHKALQENTSAYDTQIAQYDKEVAASIALLKQPEK